MKTCFFIGHRDAPEGIFHLLTEAVERHISEYGVETFVVGNYGSFDRMAARAVGMAKQDRPEIKLLLLLPYYDPLKKPGIPSCFDGSLYPEGMEKVPKRAAIVRVNQYMVRHCDFLIAIDRGQTGNTREILRMARTREAEGLLRIENLADRWDGSGLDCSKS